MLGEWRGARILGAAGPVEQLHARGLLLGSSTMHKTQHFLSICFVISIMKIFPGVLRSSQLEITAPEGITTSIPCYCFCGLVVCWVLMFVVEAGGYYVLLVLRLMVCVGSCFYNKWTGGPDLNCGVLFPFVRNMGVMRINVEDVNAMEKQAMRPS